MVNADGTLWVQQVQVPSTFTAEEASAVDPTAGWGSRTWDVFDGDGRYLGETEFPPRFRLMALRGNHAYGTWQDELDVQYVVRLQIVRGCD